MTRKLAPRCPKCNLRYKDLQKHIAHAHPTLNRKVGWTPPKVDTDSPAKRHWDATRAAGAKYWENPPLCINRPDRLNHYTCQRDPKHTMTTIDTHEGTSPFMVGCCWDDCTSPMVSSFYRVDKSRFHQVTHEWRCPTAAEYARMGQAERNHADLGGLFCHKLPTPIHYDHCGRKLHEPVFHVDVAAPGADDRTAVAVVATNTGDVVRAVTEHELVRKALEDPATLIALSDRDRQAGRDIANPKFDLDLFKRTMSEGGFVAPSDPPSPPADGE